MAPLVRSEKSACLSIVSWYDRGPRQSGLVSLWPQRPVQVLASRRGYSTRSARGSHELTKRAGGSGRATDSQFRCSGSRSQDRLSRACWPACPRQTPGLSFPDAGPFSRPSHLELAFPLSLVSIQKLQKLNSWRRMARDFQHTTAKFPTHEDPLDRVKRAKRPGGSARSHERRWPPRARRTRDSK